MAKSVERLKQQQAQDNRQLDTKTRLMEELALVGSECRGENHRELIEKQRYALSQLRSICRSPPTGG